MHRSSQLCSLSSVEELLIFEDVVQSLLNMSLYEVFSWIFDWTMYQSSTWICLIKKTSHLRPIYLTLPYLASFFLTAGAAKTCDVSRRWREVPGCGGSLHQGRQTPWGHRHVRAPAGLGSCLASGGFVRPCGHAWYLGAFINTRSLFYQPHRGSSRPPTSPAGVCPPPPWNMCWSSSEDGTNSHLAPSGWRQSSRSASTILC